MWWYHTAVVCPLQKASWVFLAKTCPISYSESLRCLPSTSCQCIVHTALLNMFKQWQESVILLMQKICILLWKSSIGWLCSLICDFKKCLSLQWHENDWFLHNFVSNWLSISSVLHRYCSSWPQYECYYNPLSLLMIDMYAGWGGDAGGDDRSYAAAVEVTPGDPGWVCLIITRLTPVQLPG